MRIRLSKLAVLVSGLALLGLLLSCAPQATPVPAPATATPAPAATPRVAPATPTPGATPAPTPGAAPARPAWQAEWEKTVAEAVREGKVVIYGPPGPNVRLALTEGFEKAYPGISVDYTSSTGSAVAPRLTTERNAGIFTVDLHIGGTTTILTSLKPFAVPIEQFLILPEVKDPKNWWGGKLDFADEEGKYNLCFTTYAKSAAAYNTALLEPSKAEKLSYWDLTKPEWKGKVLWSDPRVAGPGLATGTFFVMHPQLGPDFVKALAQNDLLLSRSQRQMAEWVARGKYVIQLAPDDQEVIAFIEAGAPIKFLFALKEGTYATAAYGSVIVIDKAPHPNATKVYLNWLLTKEGQIAWSKGSGYPSRRLDVPTAHLDAGTLLKPGVSYQFAYKEDIVKKKDEVRQVLQTVFGK